jgi:phospholipase C
MLQNGRRDFMRKMAAIAATSTTASLLPPGVKQALALPARRVTGTIHDVEHVVILMQENRSFDHYFGALRGVHGFGDPRPVPLPGGKNVFQQPGPNNHGTLLPFRLNTQTTSAARLKSLDHSWKASQAKWNNWDVWVEKKTPFTLGHLVREDIPYYYALADAFTICDAYHASIFGPTDPNRLYFFSGTSGLAVGDHGAQVVTNGDDQNWTADMALDAPDFTGFGWTTYADRLEATGVSWKLYQEYDNFGDNSLALFLPPVNSHHNNHSPW